MILNKFRDPQKLPDSLVEMPQCRRKSGKEEVEHLSSTRSKKAWLWKVIICAWLYPPTRIWGPMNREEFRLSSMQLSYNRCVSENNLQRENLEWTLNCGPATHIAFLQPHIFIQFPDFIFKSVCRTVLDCTINWFF